MDNAVEQVQRTVDDSGSPFEVLVLKPSDPRASVLFAAGAGGAPERHLPLLKSIAARGCIVTAPSFVRLASSFPTGAELSMRARRVQLALDSVQQPNLPLVGVGHSIGAAVLLILAGAEASTLGGDIVRAPFSAPFRRLALLAPPTQFFRAPGALDEMQSEIAVWIGEKDEITPPANARYLERALHGKASMRLRIAAEAGHFSYMDVLPPHVTDTLQDRKTFLEALAEEVGSFVVES